MGERQYVCSDCGEPRPRELLITKRVMFQTVGGKNYRVIKSRTIKLLCEVCCLADRDWNVERYASPISSESVYDPV